MAAILPGLEADMDMCSAAMLAKTHSLQGWQQPVQLWPGEAALEAAPHSRTLGAGLSSARRGGASAASPAGGSTA